MADGSRKRPASSDIAESEDAPDAKVGIGAMLGGGVLSVMNESGPTVVCVHLLADGTSKEVELDMTPKANAAGKLLGGALSFVGQFHQTNVVAMSLRNTEGQPKSKHTLPPPLHDAELHGDVLLVRMDDEAAPQSYSLAEHEAFLKEDHSEALKLYEEMLAGEAEMEAALQALGEEGEEEDGEGAAEEDDEDDGEEDEAGEEDDDEDEDDEDEEGEGEAGAKPECAIM